MTHIAESLPLESIDPVRLKEVATWLQTTIRPVARVLEDGLLPSDQPRMPQFESRDYQLEALVKLEDRRAAGGKRALGNLATGLGKTFVAAADVARYREQYISENHGFSPYVLYVSHQDHINRQAQKTFQAIMPDVDYGFFNPRRKELPEADVAFATIQSIYANLDLFDPESYEYIVWDESHHLEAATYRVVRGHFSPLFEHAITATLRRTDRKDIQKYFGAPLYQKSLPEGIADGYLANVNYRIVLDKTTKEAIQHDGFQPKTLEDIEALFKVKPPREAIASHIEEEIKNLGLVDPKTMVFCDSIDEAEEMAALLGGVAYHSKAQNHEQKLNAFRAGSIRRIFTRDMLNEAIDIPDAELIIFLRSTNSDIVFEQQLGRGLRLADGKGTVYVLDFVANIERIIKLREFGEAIQARIRANDETAAGSEATERGAAEPIAEDTRTTQGLLLHSSHSDFEFDQVAIDLLEEYYKLSANLLPPAPEDYESIASTAARYGVTPRFIRQVLDELGWSISSLPEYKFGPNVGRGVGPDLIATLDKHPMLIRDANVLNLARVRERYGVHDVTLNKMIKEMGWELPSRMVGDSSKLAKVLTLDQVEELKLKFPDNFLPAIPDGSLSTYAAATELGVSRKTLAAIVADKGWKLLRYKANQGPTDTLTQEQIAEARLDPRVKSTADDSIIKITVLTKQLGTTKVFMKKALAESGISVADYKFDDVIAPGVKVSDIETIKSALPQAMPEGWESIVDVAEDLGIDPETIRSFAKRNNWGSFPQYIGGRHNKLTQALSPAQIRFLTKRHRG